MQKLNLSKPNLRKFGIIMAVAFLVVAAIIYFKHKAVVFWPFFVSGAFGLTGIGVPVLLKPVYVIWMKLAFILGWVNTRLILFALFYLLITPIAVMLKLFRNDLLEKKIEKERPSYWKRKEAKEFLKDDYERQF